MPSASKQQRHLSDCGNTGSSVPLQFAYIDRFSLHVLTIILALLFDLLRFQLSSVSNNKCFYLFELCELKLIW